MYADEEEEHALPSHVLDRGVPAAIVAGVAVVALLLVLSGCQNEERVRKNYEAAVDSVVVEGGLVDSVGNENFARELAVDDDVGDGHLLIDASLAYSGIAVVVDAIERTLDDSLPVDDSVVVPELESDYRADMPLDSTPWHPVIVLGYVGAVPGDHFVPHLLLLPPVSLGNASLRPPVPNAVALVQQSVFSLPLDLPRYHLVQALPVVRLPLPSSFLPPIFVSPPLFSDARHPLLQMLTFVGPN